MNGNIKVVKMHSKEEMEDDGYIADPEEALNVLEALREEAGKFLYENTETFQRVFNVIGKKQS
jgi:hypothetical protein